jgi:hypothetical protein
MGTVPCRFDIAPVAAVGDEDAHTGSAVPPEAGGDSMPLNVSLGDAMRPFTVEATRRRQAIGLRWLAELLSVDAPETRALGALVCRLDRSRETMATGPVIVP